MSVNTAIANVAERARELVRLYDEFGAVGSVLSEPMERLDDALQGLGDAVDVALAAEVDTEEVRSLSVAEFRREEGL